MAAHSKCALPAHDRIRHRRQSFARSDRGQSDPAGARQDRSSQKFWSRHRARCECRRSLPNLMEVLAMPTYANTVTRIYLLGGLMLMGLISPALSDDFPSKPIHIMVATAAGGPTDLTARVIGKFIS